MRRFVLLLLLCALAVPLRATVLIPIEFRELVTVSPVIVHGHVVDVRGEWVDGRRAIETVVTVAPDEYLKGDLGSMLTFEVPGGQLGRYRTIFVGAPVFAPGDDVVLFLDARGGEKPHVVGLSQGVFRVVADPRTGAPVVVPPAVMQRRTQADVEPIVRGDVTRKALPLASFRQAVTQVMAEAGR